jgi:hypothetical protein
MPDRVYQAYQHINVVLPPFLRVVLHDPLLHEAVLASFSHFK